MGTIRRLDGIIYVLDTVKLLHFFLYRKLLSFPRGNLVKLESSGSFVMKIILHSDDSYILFFRRQRFLPLHCPMHSTDCE